MAKTNSTRRYRNGHVSRIARQIHGVFCMDPNYPVALALGLPEHTGQLAAIEAWIEREFSYDLSLLGKICVVDVMPVLSAELHSYNQGAANDDQY